MRTTTPDEDGWYWCEDKNGDWMLTFVDMLQERAWLIDETSLMEDWIGLEDVDGYGIVRWFGPLVCPGGDFGGPTVILDAQRHNEAAKEGKAIVLTHVDFKHCPDEKHHSRVTVTALMDREKAEKIISRECR